MAILTKVNSIGHGATVSYSNNNKPKTLLNNNNNIIDNSKLIASELIMKFTGIWMPNASNISNALYDGNIRLVLLHMDLMCIELVIYPDYVNFDSWTEPYFSYVNKKEEYYNMKKELGIE